MNFRSKERVLPKAFAKIEINDEKSVVALYVENLKNLKDGYDVIALRTDYAGGIAGQHTCLRCGRMLFCHCRYGQTISPQALSNQRGIPDLRACIQNMACGKHGWRNTGCLFRVLTRLALLPDALWPGYSRSVLHLVDIAVYCASDDGGGGNGAGNGRPFYL